MRGLTKSCLLLLELIDWYWLRIEQSRALEKQWEVHRGEGTLVGLGAVAGSAEQCGLPAGLAARPLAAH